MIRWRFRPQLRHPLARLLAAIVGGAALLLLFVFGLFAAAALIVGGAFFLLVNALRAKAPAAAVRPTPPGVIEGEFHVVNEPAGHRTSAR